MTALRLQITLHYQKRWHEHLLRFPDKPVKHFSGIQASKSGDKNVGVLCWNNGLLGQLPRKDSILVDKMRCQNNALNLFAHTSVSHNQLVNLRRNCNVGRHEFLSIVLLCQRIIPTISLPLHFDINEDNYCISVNIL